MPASRVGVFKASVTNSIMDHGHQFRSENAIQNRGPEESGSHRINVQEFIDSPVRLAFSASDRGISDSDFALV